MIVATNAICYELFTYKPNCTFYVDHMTLEHDCQIVTWHSTMTVKLSHDIQPLIATQIVIWHLALNCHTNCLMTFNPWLSMKLSHDIQPLNVTLIVTWHSTLTVKEIVTWHSVLNCHTNCVTWHSTLTDKQIVTWHLFHACMTAHTHIHTYIHTNTINVTWHWPVHSLCLRSQWHQSARLTTDGLDSWCSQ